MGQWKGSGQKLAVGVHVCRTWNLVVEAWKEIVCDAVVFVSHMEKSQKGQEVLQNHRLKGIGEWPIVYGFYWKE